MGKTVSLLRLWEELLGDGICALYIPLHEIMSVVTKNFKSEDVIKKFMTDSLWYGNEQKAVQFSEYLSKCTGKPALVLLLDGFNEIPSGNRIAAIKAIKKWMVIQGVQIVISSRYDFRQGNSIENLNELIIEPLSNHQIDTWFQLCEMPVPDKSQKVYELLKTPFMLTLYTQAETRYNQGKDAPFVKWIDHAGTSSGLMWNFMQCQILKMANDRLKPPKDILKAVIASMYILPYICWAMEWRELFAVDAVKLNQWISEAVSLYKAKWKNAPDPWICSLEIKLGTIQWNKKDFPEILVEELNLLINRNDETYSLLHQNFRDFLAAVHLYQVVKTNMPKEIDETWRKRPFSENVVTFLAEWMPEEKADAMFQSLRGKQISEGDYIFFNLIRVIRKIKQDDLSEMDFSDMDLRTVVLNGARLVNGTHRAVFRRAQINYRTLAMQGHHDAIYFVAFSEDGSQLISATTSEIRIWDIRTGNCIHEITEGPAYPGGSFEYNEPKYHKKFIMADGREFVWIGENDTCTDKYINVFADLLQCSDDWKNPPRKYNYMSSKITDPVGLLPYKKDSKTIAIQDGSVMITLPTGEERMLTGNQTMAASANLSRDMKYCAAGLSDGGICIWDLETDRVITEFSKSTHHICYIDGNRPLYIGQTSGIVMFWERDWDEYKVCSRVLEGRRSPVTFVSAANDLCFVSHEDDVVEVWSLSENRIIKTMEQYQYISISEDGNFICVQTSDGDVWYYNQKTQEKKVLWTGLGRPCTALCIGSNIYKYDNGNRDNTLEDFYLGEEQFRPIQYSSCGDYRKAFRISSRSNWVFIGHGKRPVPCGIYTIVNLNFYGCDFTDAIFETLELAAIVKSNGGILELSEEYHLRSVPVWERTFPAPPG